jgi:hypothetical protein
LLHVYRAGGFGGLALFLGARWCHVEVLYGDLLEVLVFEGFSMIKEQW